MSRYVFDAETNGLLPELTTVHSLCIQDIDTKEFYSLHGGDIEWGVRLLQEAEVLIGHNIIGFDILALQKVFPWFNPNALLLDTLVLARLVYPDIKQRDFEMEGQEAKKGKEWIPKKFFGRHSLESWGHRLGNYKGDYKGPWDEWSPEMQEYCDQDVRVTLTLFKRILKILRKWGIDPFDPCPAPGRDCVVLEHSVALIISRQERYGFAFDTAAAGKLYSKLVARREELTEDLRKSFGPWWRRRSKEIRPAKRQVRKRTDLDFEVTRRRFGKNGKELKPYVGPLEETIDPEGPFVKIELVPFNPGSRDDVADRLMKLRGWKPKEFTKDGKPKVDEEVLSSLPYPEAQLLTEYYTIQKRLGQIAEGKEAWIKAVHKDGRIYGSVNTNGAVTGRMTHSRPNMAQVPSGRSMFGEECRSLFIAGPGRVLVGADADGLEQRDLAGYMARFDGGAFIKTVLEGNKEEKTDLHNVVARALGCDRETAKTWFYAFIYGAGDFKLGLILGGKKSAMKVGAESRKKIAKNLPALGKLTDRVKKKSNKKGYVVGLDGRQITVRSEHSALNTLLQGAGAIQMKRALAILDTNLQEQEEFTPGNEYEFVANVHDEWQIEVDPNVAQNVSRQATEAIRLAGEYYGFRCPLSGSADVGASWAETH